jgi:hypothetical protein
VCSGAGGGCRCGQVCEYGGGAMKAFMVGGFCYLGK